MILVNRFLSLSLLLTWVLDAGETVEVEQKAPVEVTFTSKDGNVSRIQDNHLFSKNPEGNWSDSGKFGMWVSDSCFVYPLV